MDDEHEDDDENDDDSRTERDASAGEPSHGVDEERAGEPVTADEKPSRDVGDQPDESGERQGEITQPNDGELVRAISMLVQSGISESYSGMLPRPSDFNKYPADVQERMCRWNDAFTVDESNRQNQLVKAEIESEPQRHVGQRRFVRGRIADELHIVLGHIESMVVWFPGGSGGDHNRQPVRADRVKKQPRQGKTHRTRTGERRPTKRVTFIS